MKSGARAPGHRPLGRSWHATRSANSPEQAETDANFISRDADARIGGFATPGRYRLASAAAFLGPDLQQNFAPVLGHPSSKMDDCSSFGLSIEDG